MLAERVLAVAKESLLIRIDEARTDPWLWEHSERVMHLTALVAALPEPSQHAADVDALAAAALFHDAGWAVQFRQGRCERWQILGRPTNDIQREFGAALLQEKIGNLLPAKTARLAAEAVRQSNDRRTALHEARILAEAETLDEVGLHYVLRQFRQYQAEGRPVQQLVSSWRRQQEYRYWELRLQDGFHFESTRQLARQRLDSVNAFMVVLDRELKGEDVRASVSAPDASPPPAN